MGAPALLAGQADQVLGLLNSLNSRVRNFVEQGGLVTDGGTTQASGANTAPNFDADVSQLVGAVDGVGFDLAAGTDVDSDGGAGIDFNATSGKTVIVAVFVETGAANDTPAFGSVAGAVADTGDQIAPTEAEIEAAVGHSNWLLLCDVTLTRTGDTTITFTPSHARRITGLGLAQALATTEAGYRTL